MLCSTQKYNKTYFQKDNGLSRQIGYSYIFPFIFTNFIYGLTISFITNSFKSFDSCDAFVRFFNIPIPNVSINDGNNFSRHLPRFDHDGVVFLKYGIFELCA